MGRMHRCAAGRRWPAVRALACRAQPRHMPPYSTHVPVAVRLLRSVAALTRARGRNHPRRHVGHPVGSDIDISLVARAATPAGRQAEAEAQPCVDHHGCRADKWLLHPVATRRSAVRGRLALLLELPWCRPLDVNHLRCDRLSCGRLRCDWLLRHIWGCGRGPRGIGGCETTTPWRGSCDAAPPVPNFGLP